MGGKRANIIARLPLGSRETPSSPSRLLLFFCARPRRPEAVERASSLALPSLTRTTYELASVGIGFLSVALSSSLVGSEGRDTPFPLWWFSHLKAKDDHRLQCVCVIIMMVKQKNGQHHKKYFLNYHVTEADLSFLECQLRHWVALPSPNL